MPNQLFSIGRASDAGERTASPSAMASVRSGPTKRPRRRLTALRTFAAYMPALKVKASTGVPVLALMNVTCRGNAGPWLGRSSPACGSGVAVDEI
jgi:hypothetical protein